MLETTAIRVMVVENDDPKTVQFCIVSKRNEDYMQGELFSGMLLFRKGILKKRKETEKAIASISCATTLKQVQQAIQSREQDFTWLNYRT
jgi:hypothetical protein